MLNTRHYGDQDAWRRYECVNLHRWSHRSSAGLRAAMHHGRTTDEAIRLILESRDISCCAMARRLGLSTQNVRRIRLGQRNTGVLPEIPRWTLAECLQLQRKGPQLNRNAPHLCPFCAAKGRVFESRVTSSGGRRKRRLCPNGHRWTEWIGERPAIGRGQGVKDESFRFRDRLTEDQVRLILERRDLGLGAAALLVGRSREAVRYIRLGRSYRDVLPEIPRWKPGERAVQVVSMAERRWHTPTCRDCVHWSCGCTMGFPDAEIEGITFALECATFERGEELAAA